MYCGISYRSMVDSIVRSIVQSAAELLVESIIDSIVESFSIFRGIECRIEGWTAC